MRMNLSTLIKTVSLANLTQRNAQSETTAPKAAISDKAMIARLWRGYIWPQKSRLTLAIVFMAILAAATASYGFVIAYIVDSAQALASGETDMDALTKAKRYASLAIPVLLGITLISGVSNYIQCILANAIALNAVGDLQKQMFASVQKADYASFAREPVGNLISKFTNDVTIISNALVRTLSNIIKDVLTVLFVVGAMLWSNWQLTLLVGLIYPLAFLPIILISKRMRGDATHVQSHIGTLTSELKENFGAPRMVRAYGLEARETKRLGLSFDERIKRYLKLVTEQARIDPILEVLGGLAIAGIVVFGVFQVSANQATAGSIAAILTWVLILSPRLRALGTLNNVVQEGLAALTRVFGVIDETPDIINAKDARDLINPRGQIEFENVSFSYPDGTAAINNISFHANPGETIALVGISGGGKTTVMNLIPRLYDTNSGVIKIDGHDVKSLTQSSLRDNMALVGQNVTIFNATVAVNIGFGDLSAQREDIIQAARAAEAHEFIMALTDGYDTIIQEDGNSLSGGQKQRIAIARAFLRDAPILLLDEATSALDAETELKVQNALERLTQAPTTIMIAHRLSTIKNADRIYVLDKGEIVEIGTHASLSKKRGGAYRRLLKAQDIS